MSELTQPPAPHRLLVLGDTHAYRAGMQTAVKRATELGCDTILSVGDFGYWPRDGDGQGFLAKTRQALARAGINLYFVEGNHDDIDSLFDDDLPQAGPFRLVAKPYRRASRGGIYYIPRGARWDWQGVRFLGVGGAFSIDQDEQREGFDWFPRELLSFAEKDAIIVEGGEADVVVAHDCPAGPLYLNQFAEFPDSTQNREWLASICASARPLLILHGHYHAFHDTLHHDYGRGLHARVLGLDCVYVDELDRRSSFLLDLDEFAPTLPSLRLSLYDDRTR